MAELKQQMKKHVKAAKEWLGKAEHSFDQENEIRGDLNLMLAQAELKHAQETKRADKKKNRYQALLMHSLLAAGVAGLVVVIGFGGLGLFTVKPVNSVIPMKAPEQALPGGFHQGTEIEKPQSAKDEAPILQEPVTVNPSESTEVKYTIDAVSSPVQNSGQERAQEPEIHMPPAEMQQLMRAAGKSLRGQG